MKSRFITSGAPLTNPRETIPIPAGNLKGLLVRIVGNAAAGVTVVLANLGRVRLIREGKTIVDTTMDFLSNWGNLKGGFFEADVSAGAGNAYMFSFIVPVEVPGNQNSLLIRNNDELKLELSFGTISTAAVSDSVTYTLDMLTDDSSVERYVLEITEQNIAAGAASRLKEVLSGQNISNIYVRDAGAVVDRVTFTIDGESHFDGDDALLRAYTSMINRIEATGFGWGEIAAMEPGALVTTFNNTVALEANFTGAGTLEATIFHVNLSKNTSQSISVAQAVAGAKSRIAARNAPNNMTPPQLSAILRTNVNSARTLSAV